MSRLTLRNALAASLLLATLAPIARAQAPQPAAPLPPPPAHLVEKEILIPSPGSVPPGLDVLEVYFDRGGKYPLAVLTHGTSNEPLERAHVTPWSQLQQAQWFARRGYVAMVVVRSGYGRSGGKEDGSNGGCNNHGSFEETGEASAADLRAVMKFAESLPEVEPGTIVSAGVSTGGFAQVALSADPPPCLKAAISFAGGRGGDGKEHNCDLDRLTGAFKAYGKSAHKHGDLPMLWIYSENDHWFPPAMAQQFATAYKKDGATMDFVLAPPDGTDGHHLYGHVAAWSEDVQAFLKEKNLLPLGDTVLPAPEPPNVPMPAGLQEKDEEMWRRFLLAAPFNTLVVDEKGKLSMDTAGFDQSLADNTAKDRCKKGGGTTCTLVAKTPGLK